MSTDLARWLRDATSRRTVLKGTGAALGTSLLGGVGAAKRGNGQQKGPRITAHRGFAGTYPQNTLAAVEGASHLKADRIEIDIMPCADGEIVVFHDYRLDNLTDEEGAVPQTPCDIVLQAEVLDSGETIPTLAETLDAVRPNVTMNIEFKGSGEFSWEEIARRVFAVTAEFPHDIFVSSFSTDALEGVRAVAPEVPIGKLFGRNNKQNLEVARRLDAEAINPSQTTLDRELVETAHSEGRDVNVYTIRNWNQAERVVELGVDGLIADYPSMLEFATRRKSG
jgi:glycerophosphoryl diester phosphodiesterase